MMAGAGLDPRRGLFPPFMKADLDRARRRAREARAGRRRSTASASRRRRSCAGSSPRAASGQKSGQGFYAYPQPDDEQPGEAVKLETRGDVAIAWLANGQMNSIAPQVIRDLGAVWEAVEGRRRARARHRLGQPAAVLRRRRHQGLHADGRGGRRASCSTRRTRCCASSGTEGDRDDRRGQRRSPSAAAASWRWPATCASPRSRRSSASPRSSSGSSPASAARSACRGSWARARRSR